MRRILNTLLILLLIIIIILYSDTYKVENFYQNFQGLNGVYPYENIYSPYDPWLQYPLLRHTRNMSYDLRQDPLIIPQFQYIWNNPE